jgi:DNA-binding LytR/AlgR family response regulator
MERRLPLWAAVLLQGVLTGLAITPVVFVLTFLFFPGLPPLPALFSLAAQGVVIAVVVTAVIAVVGAQLAPKSASEAQSAGPPLLARLPLDRRGRIFALSAEDHYTRVRTSLGEVLVLMRLSDAIDLAAPIEGVQIHRSHWVAVAAVVGVRRHGDGAMVRLTDGAELPASRRNIPALRDAGLMTR